MLKILIVEDEDFERRALKFLVEKYFSEEIIVVGEATNGQEALDQIFSLQPDLILMDINMPIMDGLKASKIIKKLNKNIEILILTAYDTFTYAQEALKCGVSDYLVKPFTNRDFALAISNAIENIRAKQTVIEQQSQLDENLRRAVVFIEKRLVTQIIYGDQFSLSDLEEGIKILKIKSLTACCLIISNLTNMNFKEESLQSIKNILNCSFSQVIGAKFLDYMVFFVFDNNIKDIILSDKVNNIITKIKTHYIEHENMDVNINIGPIAKDVKDYNWSYDQATLSLYKNSDVEAIPDSVVVNNQIHISNCENIIISKIMNEDLESGLEETKILLSLIVTQYSDNNINQIKQAINITINKIITNVSDFIDSDRRTALSNYIQSRILSLDNLNDINVYLSILIKELVQDISEYNNINNLNILTKAKKFINANYMNDIKLEDVAKHVCISSYYFSRIFKKHEGINYIQYLTKVRMEKAKSLILEEKNTIKEIAIDVGYMDQNYFSRAFKKYTGASPKSFLYSIYECCNGD